MNGQLRKKLTAIGEATEVCLRVVFPDGSSYQSRDRAPDATVIIRNSRVAWRVLLFGHVGFLEAYFDGDVDVEGSLALAFRAAMDAGFDERPTFLVSVRNWWHELLYSNASIAQAKANARFHYGPGQDFYREWLDQVGMAYTCSWFMDGTKTLEEAQISKMDHVCKKVLLKAGDTFADIGSGWGNLLFYAWEKYGAHGTGINATTEQVLESREEIKRRGLEGKVEVLERDFREVPRQFDKLLSIGTLEHAGRDQLGEVIQAHANYLKPGGLGVLHFIGHVGVRDTEFWIRKYIFPGGWIPSLAEAIDWCERCGLEVVDIENLRRNYALTLDDWAQRFDRNWDKVRQLDPKKYDEKFRRIWRTYLWACAEMFRSPKGKTHLFQIVVSKGNIGDNYPMSRGFLYR
ncbi:MAG TPA: cyclopropane-fatty-acyl-phospholipid synthase family protein [Burkholderiales bacterium]|nr:cyclopropane-fatty-acyl-phospholipid synthase family protein [Burkholderiales bacterium]